MMPLKVCLVLSVISSFNLQQYRKEKTECNETSTFGIVTINHEANSLE